MRQERCRKNFPGGLMSEERKLIELLDRVVSSPEGLFDDKGKQEIVSFLEKYKNPKESCQDPVVFMRSLLDKTVRYSWGPDFFVLLFESVLTPFPAESAEDKVTRRANFDK